MLLKAVYLFLQVEVLTGEDSEDEMEDIEDGIAIQVKDIPVFLYLYRGIPVSVYPCNLYPCIMYSVSCSYVSLYHVPCPPVPRYPCILYLDTG